MIGELKGIFAGMKPVINKVSGAVDNVSNFAGKVTDAVTSSAGQSYVRQFFDSGIWDEGMFNENESTALSDIVKKQVSKNKSSISYRDYDREGGKGIGYGMGIPDLSDPRKSLKMTLGKGSIVRDGSGNVMVVDEYDFAGGGNLKKLPLGEKVQALIDAVTNPDISKYGIAHLFAEAFGSTEGEGASVRAKVGTAETLGLSIEQLNKLPTLEEYESKNKGRIKQRKAKAAETVEPIKETAVAQEPEPIKETATLKVKSGDSLSQIAKDNNTTVEALAELNGIEDVDKIYIGQELVLN